MGRGAGNGNGFSSLSVNKAGLRTQPLRPMKVSLTTGNNSTELIYCSSSLDSPGTMNAQWVQVGTGEK